MSTGHTDREALRPTEKAEGGRVRDKENDQIYRAELSLAQFISGIISPRRPHFVATSHFVAIAVVGRTARRVRPAEAWAKWHPPSSSTRAGSSYPIIQIGQRGQRPPVGGGVRRAGLPALSTTPRRSPDPITRRQETRGGARGGAVQGCVVPLRAGRAPHRRPRARRGGQPALVAIVGTIQRPA